MASVAAIGFAGECDRHGIGIKEILNLRCADYPSPIAVSNLNLFNILQHDKDRFSVKQVLCLLLF
jgi:hypothetical protein